MAVVTKGCSFFDAEVRIRGPVPFVFTVLPGEKITCSFDEGFTAVPSIEWFREGVKLTSEQGKMRINPVPEGSTLEFITPESIVPGNYSCRATLNGIEATANQEIVPAGRTLGLQ